MNADPFASSGLRRRSLLLLPLLLLLVGTALWRLHLTYDLAFFLPAPQSDAQRVLVERLGQGPGAELIFVTLPDAPPEQVSALATTLRGNALIRTVWPNQDALATELPEVLRHNRLLLGELPASVNAWQAALDARALDLSSAPDDALFSMIAQDPALLALNAVSALQGDFDPNALFDHDPPMLVLRSVAPAFDMDAQLRIHDTLRDALHNIDTTQAGLYGSGMYGVALQSAVRRESIVFSLLASVALALLVLWRFRSVTALFSSALPLLIGGASGLLALALLSDRVHGITLAFGFTLLGVALDYPLHLFTHHCEQPGAPTNRLWATLQLGILSTLLAYGAFLLSGAGGLLQLGIFACVGIAAAALSTAFLGGGMADLAGNSATSPSAATTTTEQLSHGPWLLALACSLPLLTVLPLFNDDLGTLTPVPASTLAQDSALRAQLGTVDLRHLIAVRQPSLEQTLQATEQLSVPLQQARARTLLTAYQSVTSLLPSQAQQALRRAHVTKQLTHSWFEQASASSIFRSEAFAPFLATLKTESQRTDWLTIDDLYRDPLLSDALQAQLYQTQGQWVSLVFVRGLQQPAELATLLDQHSSAELIDLKQAAVTLVSDYRQRLLRVLGMALLAVAALLWLRTSDLRRTIWLLGTVTSAVALAALGNILLLTSLSLFDLMALALVAGLGLDYALFYSRSDPDAVARQASPRAVLICAISSLLVFGILSLSSIPLLKGIGTTVAIGVVAAYLLARLGRYEKPAI